MRRPAIRMQTRSGRHVRVHDVAPWFVSLRIMLNYLVLFDVPMTRRQQVSNQRVERVTCKVSFLSFQR